MVSEQSNSALPMTLNDL